MKSATSTDSKEGTPGGAGAPYDAPFRYRMVLKFDGFERVVEGEYPARVSETGTNWREVAHEAFLQLEYLHQRERPHSSTEAMLIRLSEKLGVPLESNPLKPQPERTVPCVAVAPGDAEAMALVKLYHLQITKTLRTPDDPRGLWIVSNTDKWVSEPTGDLNAAVHDCVAKMKRSHERQEKREKS